MSHENAKKLDISEIPLPPDDGSENISTQEEVPVQTTEQETTTNDEPICARLDYVKGDYGFSVPLKRAFYHNGEEVREIKGDRLTIGQVQKLTKNFVREGTIEMFDIYAEMTGVEADVLRGLIDEDGEDLVDAAEDFLPRAFRGETENE